jgi:ATP-dependent DNA helicase RecQ
VAGISAKISQLAREVLGHDELRPGQAEAVQAVLDGRDTLAVMATGYGKSAIYQLAGLLVDGPTLVISPLIALQRDQVDHLDDEALGGAATVSSAVSKAERESALQRAEQGDLEFLFMAPEQLANPDVLEDVRQAGPKLMVVDEAHCISEWGHDFRPEYLRLGAFAEALGHPTILALTATAAPPVREEILGRLGLRDPEVIVTGFDRPNLWFGVRRFHEEHAKEEALAEHLAELAKPGIVYTATRKDAERLADELSERTDLSVVAYHGGMRGRERDEVQEAFMADEIDVIVATTAFGMGVDKANVRFVIHHVVPDSMDAYWQEIGRAGRDGEPAEALLLYRPEDLGLRRFFGGAGQVDAAEIDNVARALDAARPDPADPTEVQERTDLSATKLAAAVGRLEDVGAVRVRADGLLEATEELGPEAIIRAAREQDDREAFARSRIDMVRSYAELHDACRRQFLLSYLGEPAPEPCGHCDVCDAGKAVQLEDVPFPVGARVQHPKWGVATVQRYEEDKVVVLFDDVGYKALALDAVRDGDLLAPV